jgi:hypothetical protein
MHDRRGFALLEVLIAATLLVALAAGMARVLAAAIREGTASRLRALAIISAADKIEELRSVPLTVVVSGTDYVDAAGVSLGSGGPRPAAAVFARRWFVQPIGGDASVVSLRIDVTTSDGALAARLVTVRAAR